MSKIYITRYRGFGRGDDLVERFWGVIDNTKEARQKFIDENIEEDEFDEEYIEDFINGDLSDFEEDNCGAEWDEALCYGYSFTLLEDKIKEAEEALKELKSYL